ncbi:MAG: alpha/beta hydrolase [bacterium]|nr:alpha/beta hydrolase [bacterium]
MSLQWRLILLLVILCIAYLWKASQLIIAPKRFISPYKPDNFGLKYENISLITNDGITLKTWFIPAPADKVVEATIIICHGYGTDKGDCIDIAQFLHRAGYNVVMFDFRGHGQSGGKYCSLGYYECEDVKTVIRWLKSNSTFRGSGVLKGEGMSTLPLKIGAIGVSMGGTVALMVQAEEPALLAVVSDGAYLSFYSAVTSFARKHFKAPKYPFIPPAVWAAGLRLKFKPKELNLIKFMPKIAPKPILIIHGSEDREIQTQDAYEIFKAASKPKELWIVEGAQHLESYYIARDEYEQKVINFFKSAFK